MTERLQPSGADRPVDVGPEGGPTLFGLPAEFPEESDGDRLPAGRTPSDASPRLAVVKRADVAGAAALVLAGVAANVSLSLSWWPGEGPPGLSLVRQGAEALDAGVDHAVRAVVWQPLAVVACGGLLVLLGFLLLVPARGHRLIGVLALAVSLTAAAAVALLLVDGGLLSVGFGPGMWCAVAVPVLGVLGSLKAMLTAPLVTLDSR
ncbi:hypothetical protein [Blastococcus haudaquaticus]|uniref:Uncharacterized protein n=1 Tax=Blastococcus haudaquaticus TaxID=1938745 RepID=A0A286H6I5_9ACTN|nr:hypothetical protein [Blastococcus haudaquaticus]SOE03378.1 hypothetical protein SAMN06272739_4125 [Blastococcus haudaquaticus]